MDILGLFNFQGELPEFDFTLNLAKANLHNLNFDKTDSSSSLSMLLTADFRGTNIDNLDGEIKLLNSSLVKFGKTLDLYDLHRVARGRECGYDAQDQWRHYARRPARSRWDAHAVRRHLRPVALGADCEQCDRRMGIGL